MQMIDDVMSDYYSDNTVDMSMIYDKFSDIDKTIINQIIDDTYPDVMKQYNYNYYENWLKENTDIIDYDSTDRPSKTNKKYNQQKVLLKYYEWFNIYGYEWNDYMCNCSYCTGGNGSQSSSSSSEVTVVTKEVIQELIDIVKNNSDEIKDLKNRMIWGHQIMQF